MLLTYYLIFITVIMVLAIPMWKISQKIGVKIPYWKYCIPIYNLVLLCRQANISILSLIFALASSIIMTIIGYDSMIVRFIITFLFFGYLSYHLAKTLGVNVLVWSCVGGLLFPIALCKFAFGKTNHTNITM